MLFRPSGKGRKRQKKGAEKADVGRFPERAARHPLNPHLLQPHLRQPNLRKYTQKLFSALKSQVPQQAKEQVWCIHENLVFRGKRRKRHIRQRGLQGVRGGPLRAVLVYRFWPPISFLEKRVSESKSPHFPSLTVYAPSRWGVLCDTPGEKESKGGRKTEAAQLFPMQ